jgi:hypothetical protein
VCMCVCVCSRVLVYMCVRARVCVCVCVSCICCPVTGLSFVPRQSAVFYQLFSPSNLLNVSPFLLFSGHDKEQTSHKENLQRVFSGLLVNSTIQSG